MMSKEKTKLNPSKRKNLEAIVTEEEAWERIFCSENFQEDVAYMCYAEHAKDSEFRRTEEEITQFLMSQYRKISISAYHHYKLQPDGKVKITYADEVVLGECFPYAEIITEDEAWRRIFDTRFFQTCVKYRTERYIYEGKDASNARPDEERSWKKRTINACPRYHMRLDKRVEIDRTY